MNIDKAEFAALDRAMRELPQKVSRKFNGQAAGYAMKVIVKDMRRRCPKRYGVLRKSLGSRRKTYRNTSTVYVAVGPRAGFKRSITEGGRTFNVNPVNYAHLVEFGTRRHSIRRSDVIGRVRARRGTKAALRRQTAGAAMHPGARAQPFMRPAFDAQKRRVVRRYITRMWKLIVSEVERQARGTRRAA